MFIRNTEQSQHYLLYCSNTCRFLSMCPRKAKIMIWRSLQLSFFWQSDWPPLRPGPEHSIPVWESSGRQTEGWIQPHSSSPRSPAQKEELWTLRILKQLAFNQDRHVCLQVRTWFQLATDTAAETRNWPTIGRKNETDELITGLCWQDGIRTLTEHDITVLN